MNADTSVGVEMAVNVGGKCSGRQSCSQDLQIVWLDVEEPFGQGVKVYLEQFNLRLKHSTFQGSSLRQKVNHSKELQELPKTEQIY